MSATSAMVESRYSPVSRVDDLMPSLKLVKATRPGSRTMSFLGSRPQSTNLLRRRADGVFDHVRRDAHDARLAVDAAAAVGEDVERLVGLDEHAGALEHLESGEMDVVELGFGEHVEAQAAAARPPGVQVAFHADTSVRGVARHAGADGVGTGRRRGCAAADVLGELLDGVDGHVEDLGDVELGLDRARFARVGELLHGDAAPGRSRGVARA